MTKPRPIGPRHNGPPTPPEEALDEIAHVVARDFKGEIGDAEAVEEIAEILDEATDDPTEAGPPPSREMVDSLVRSHEDGPVGDKRP